MKQILLSILTIWICSCNQNSTSNQVYDIPSNETGIEVIVLGNVQDGGCPHMGCHKDCCKDFYDTEDPSLKVSSIGIIDYDNNMTYIIDATPDFVSQNETMLKRANHDNQKVVDGIFLTHAHIGHYTGIMYLGREALGAKNTKVYAMPLMKKFLTTNGPWSQLVELQNIELQDLSDNIPVQLSDSLSITPFLVPHRDEYSETVGFQIMGPNKTLLFIPDIDKWHTWQKDIREEIKRVDYALLDATFYSNKEINNRDMTEIPHPFVIESIKYFEGLSLSDKNKVHFIHLNHTNPLLDKSSEAYKSVLESPFHTTQYLQSFYL